VLAYHYDTDDLLSPGRGNDDQLLGLAVTLVSDLVAERQHADASTRPLILVCHGFGGLLVKRALAFSVSQLSDAKKHLGSIYISTYGIIFAGTPHDGIQNDALSVLYPEDHAHPSQFVVQLLSGSRLVTDVANHFAPIMKRFRIHNIWEELKTSSRNTSTYIVGKVSAAPDYYDDERTGIMAGHADLLKFENPDDHGYVLVHEVLVRYIGEAPPKIRKRWQDQTAVLRDVVTSPPSQPQGHVFEQNMISGGRVHFGDVYCYNLEHAGETSDVAKTLSRPRKKPLSPTEGNPASLNELYIVPRCSSPLFTGRQLLAKMVEENLKPAAGRANGDKQAIVVLYGLGGSGKTQFCIRYAESHRLR
jgi:hypothetical protein